MVNRMVCFTTKDGRVALCQHDYLEKYKQGECETCSIKPMLEGDTYNEFTYVAFKQPTEERWKNVREEHEEDPLRYTSNCEGFYTEHGCLFRECKKFFTMGEDEWRYYGGCSLGYRPMGYSIPKPEKVIV